MTEAMSKAIENDMKSYNQYLRNKNKRLFTFSLPGGILKSKIRYIMDCKGPIPCTCIGFENGWRLDIDRTGGIQMSSPEENPYYDVKTKKHKPVK